MRELTTIFNHGKIADLLAPASRMIIEGDLLIPYLSGRRWFAAKDQEIKSARVANAGLIALPAGDLLLAELDVELDDHNENYLLPLGIVWGDDPSGALSQQLALARVRHGPRVGVLTDAFAMDALPQSIVELLRAKAVLRDHQDEIRFEPTPQLTRVDIAPDAEIRRLSAEQSNSSLIIGKEAMLKVLRRTSSGVHPEAEMSRYLTDQAYTNTPPLLGTVSRVTPDGVARMLIIVQGFVPNQGDGWTWILDSLTRTLETLSTEDDRGDEADAFAPLILIAEATGRRLAELHAVLARPSGDDAFAPEPVTAADVSAWATEILAQFDAALSAIAKVTSWSVPSAAEDAALLGSSKEELCRCIGRLAEAAEGSLKTRIHGDFHLGQVLVAKEDVFLIDFEGEPARPLDERRAKSSPIRDVAGMLRSFDYARAVTASSRTAVTPKQDESRGPILERVHAAVTAAFLDAYGQVHREAERPWASETAAAALLDLFLVQKAAYEICYEAANRVDWIGVPMRGLAELATRITSQNLVISHGV
jgi:maltose alpha-D-glucosyltransferase/alpha-amylase